jgi:hypothetical protein
MEQIPMTTTHQTAAFITVWNTLLVHLNLMSNLSIQPLHVHSKVNVT